MSDQLWDKYYSALVSKYPSLATDKNTTFQFSTGITASTALNASRFLDQKPAPGGFYKQEGSVSDAYGSLLYAIKAGEEDKNLANAIKKYEESDYTASWIDEEDSGTSNPLKKYLDDWNKGQVQKNTIEIQFDHSTKTENSWSVVGKVEGKLDKIKGFVDVSGSFSGHVEDKDLTSAIQNVTVEFHGLRTFMGERGKWISVPMIKNAMHRDFTENYTRDDFFSEEDGLLNLLPMGVVVVCKQIVKINVDDKTANYLDVAVDANAKLTVAGIFEGQANAEVKVHKDRSPGVGHYDKWVFESNEPMVLGVFSKINTLHR
jgi:hypothetical protein